MCLFSAIRLEAIPIRLEVMASRLEAIATRLESLREKKHWLAAPLNSVSGSCAPLVLLSFGRAGHSCSCPVGGSPLKEKKLALLSPLCPDLVHCLATPLFLSPPPCLGMFSFGYERSSDYSV